MKVVRINGQEYRRVGKARAGRSLDGVIWEGVPISPLAKNFLKITDLLPLRRRG